MPIPERTRATVQAILEAPPTDFLSLCRLADIDPKTDFAHADLRGVDFRGAVLENCDFTGADLEQADFSLSRVVDCSFIGANLKAARILRRARRENRFDSNADDDAEFVVPRGLAELAEANPDLLVGEWAMLQRHTRVFVYAVAMQEIRNKWVKEYVLHLEDGSGEQRVRVSQVAGKLALEPPEARAEAAWKALAAPAHHLDARALASASVDAASHDLVEVAFAAQALFGAGAARSPRGRLYDLFRQAISRLSRDLAFHFGISPRDADRLVRERLAVANPGVGEEEPG